MTIKTDQVQRAMIICVALAIPALAGLAWLAYQVMRDCEDRGGVIVDAPIWYECVEKAR